MLELRFIKTEVNDYNALNEIERLCQGLQLTVGDIFGWLKVTS